jgi:hypothetical protein
VLSTEWISNKRLHYRIFRFVPVFGSKLLMLVSSPLTPRQVNRHLFVLSSLSHRRYHSPPPAHLRCHRCHHWSLDPTGLLPMSFFPSCRIVISVVSYRPFPSVSCPFPRRVAYRIVIFPLCDIYFFSVVSYPFCHFVIFSGCVRSSFFPLYLIVLSPVVPYHPFFLCIVSSFFSLCPIVLFPLCVMSSFFRYVTSSFFPLCRTVLFPAVSYRPFFPLCHVVLSSRCAVPFVFAVSRWYRHFSVVCVVILFRCVIGIFFRCVTPTICFPICFPSYHIIIFRVVSNRLFFFRCVISSFFSRLVKEVLGNNSVQSAHKRFL